MRKGARSPCRSSSPPPIWSPIRSGPERFEMQVFAAAAVHTALPWPFLIEALRKAHLEPMPVSDVVVQSDPAGGQAQFVTLPGWAPGGPIVVKMVGVFPQNAALEPPQP